MYLIHTIDPLSAASAAAAASSTESPAASSTESPAAKPAVHVHAGSCPTLAHSSERASTESAASSALEATITDAFSATTAKGSGTYPGRAPLVLPEGSLSRHGALARHVAAESGVHLAKPLLNLARVRS